MTLMDQDFLLLKKSYWFLFLGIDKTGREIKGHELFMI